MLTTSVSEGDVAEIDWRLSWWLRASWSVRVGGRPLENDDLARSPRLKKVSFLFEQVGESEMMRPSSHARRPYLDA